MTRQLLWLVLIPILGVMCSKESPEFNKFTMQEEESTVFRRLILSSPDDVGSGHTSIIHNLQQRMEMNFPTTQIQYFQAIALAASEHLCDPFDLACNKRVMESTINIKNGPQGNTTSGIQHLKVNILPQSFDPEVMKSLEKLFFTSSLVNLKEDPLDVLRVMSKDYEELQNSDDVVNESHRIVGLVSYAVGMESAKQWHAIFNDRENPFFRFVQSINSSKEHRRNQQLAGLIGPVLGNAGAIAENVVAMAENVAGGAGGTGETNTIGSATITGVPEIPTGLEGITDGISAIAGTVGLGSSDGPVLDPTQITSMLDSPEDFDIDYTKLLEADIVGASSAAITGAFDVIGGQLSRDSSTVLSSTLEQASIASAKQVAIELMPPKPEICLFPGTALCSNENESNEKDENQNPEVEFDPNNPQNCEHPNSPYCNKTIPGPGEDVDPNGCLYPGSPYC